jgi:cellulose synthase/poly-beta-1,6-N-acetylglucosamine synthase-like glycosyltransferase
MILWLVFFWGALFLMAYSYVIYPAVISICKPQRKNNHTVWSETDPLPTVSVILAVHNEEKVIATRLRNLAESLKNFPNVEILVGSDGSSDNTNRIIEALCPEIPALKPFFFDIRKGKPSVINLLAEKAQHEICLYTDAKVLFTPSTAFQLIKHFKNNQIGIVGANIVTPNTRADGISVQEGRFMSREVMMKYHEGRLWGYPAGLYGACFAIRRCLVKPVPEGYAVDDFYQTYMVYQQGYKGILELNAICYLNVPNLIEEEFRRKVRISAGNFQNLKSFSHMLAFNALGISFFSHKVVRWFGPFLLLCIFFSNLILYYYSSVYAILLFIQCGILLLPLLDIFLQKFRIHSVTLRFVTHFFSMNLALLYGFVKHLKGVQTNVWEPTNRQH